MHKLSKEGCVLDFKSDSVTTKLHQYWKMQKSIKWSLPLRKESVDFVQFRFGLRKGDDTIYPRLPLFYVLPLRKIGRTRYSISSWSNFSLLPFLPLFNQLSGRARGDKTSLTGTARPHKSHSISLENMEPYDDEYLNIGNTWNSLKGCGLSCCFIICYAELFFCWASWQYCRIWSH